jgi:nicotinamidase-related amidase
MDAMTTIDANPYAWPWDGDLSPSRLALVISGAQRHWYSCTADPDEHLAAIQGVADALRAVGAAVVWVRHGRSPSSRNTIPVVGSDAWALVATPHDGDVVVDAAGHDGCYGGPLEPTLRAMGRDHVVMCGLGLEGPVHSTLRTLNDMGYECLTLTDASAPYDVTTGAGALSSITFSFGIFGAIAPSASLVGAFETEAVR